MREKIKKKKKKIAIIGMEKRARGFLRILACLEYFLTLLQTKKLMFQAKELIQFKITSKFLDLTKSIHVTASTVPI